MMTHRTSLLGIFSPDPQTPDSATLRSFTKLKHPKRKPSNTRIYEQLDQDEEAQNTQQLCQHVAQLGTSFTATI